MKPMQVIAVDHWFVQAKHGNVNTVLTYKTLVLKSPKLLLRASSTFPVGFAFLRSLSS